MILKGRKRYEQIQRELEEEEKQFKSMCDQFMQKDGKMTNEIIEESKKTIVSANTRKGEILKLFNEVQKT